MTTDRQTMTYQKIHPFRSIKVRAPKVKPIWHDFECLDCGAPIREYSDPRVSFFRCQSCIDALCGRKGLPQTKTIQQPGTADWWSIYCIEYAGLLNAGLIDRYGRPQTTKGYTS